MEQDEFEVAGDPPEVLPDPLLLLAGGILQQLQPHAGAFPEAVFLGRLLSPRHDLLDQPLEPEGIAELGCGEEGAEVFTREHARCILGEEEREERVQIIE